MSENYKSQQINENPTKIDDDGIEMEWIPEMKAWVPKITEEFIYMRNLNYGFINNVEEEKIDVVAEKIDNPEWFKRLSKDFQEKCAEFQSSGKILTPEEYTAKWTEFYRENSGRYEKEEKKWEKECKKRSAKPNDAVGWFEMDENKNTNVYVENLPLDITLEEFVKEMSKVGMIMNDFHTHQPKARLYKIKIDNETAKLDNQTLKIDNESKSDNQIEIDNPPKFNNQMEIGNQTKIDDPTKVDNQTKIDNQATNIENQTKLDNQAMKIDENNQWRNKGDGIVCYCKVESVQLAIDILDGAILKGNKIKVSRAKFQQKEGFDKAAANKRRKMTNKEKKKRDKHLEKLHSWSLETGKLVRPKRDCTVIVKNVFDFELIKENPEMAFDVKSKLAQTLTNLEGIKNIKIHDLQQEGIAEINFIDANYSDIAVEYLNNKLWNSRKLEASLWDGKTRYKVKETEEQEKERLEKWEKQLEGDNDKEKRSRAVQDNEDNGDETGDEDADSV